MVKAQDVVTIEIKSESGLAKALRAVDRNPVVIVSNGVRYEVNRAGASATRMTTEKHFARRCGRPPAC